MATFQLRILSLDSTVYEGEVESIRITSYNVCYTKLLRLKLHKTTLKNGRSMDLLSNQNTLLYLVAYLIAGIPFVV